MLKTVSSTVLPGDLPAGSVLQVVTQTYSTQTLSTSATYADTGLSASITPKFSSSKVLVLVSQAGVAKKSTGSNFNSVNIRLLRNSTALAVIAPGAAYTGTGIDNNIGTCSASYLDSPATTSAVTYKTQFASDQGVDGALVQTNSAVSSITLIEVKA